MRRQPAPRAGENTQQVEVTAASPRYLRRYPLTRQSFVAIPCVLWDIEFLAMESTVIATWGSRRQCPRLVAFRPWVTRACSA